MCTEHVLSLSRFEILGQICAAPQVLGQVLSEIVTRKYFKQAFTEVPSTCIGLPILLPLYFRRLSEWVDCFTNYESVRKHVDNNFLSPVVNTSYCPLFPSLTDRPPRFPVSTSLYMCSFMTLCVASDEQPRTV